MCLALLCPGLALADEGAVEPQVEVDQPSAAPAARQLTKEELLNRLSTRQARLDLERADTQMESARADYEETQRLFERRIVTLDVLRKSKHDYDEAVLRHEQAKIQLEKTRLEFLKDATLVTIVDAKKYRSADGRYIVAVTLRNDSDLNRAKSAMEGQQDVSDQWLTGLLDINNILITMLGQTGTTGLAEAIVVDPYQRIVPALRHGEEITLEYELLRRDLDALTVQVEYLGDRHDYPVFLRKEASGDLPTITSTQYAQQGQLGTRIRYDLELERLGDTEQSFSLIVLNLPSAIPFAFREPRSDARITQVKFTEEISKASLDLEVALPAKLDQSWVDRNISFFVLVTPRSELAKINELAQRYANTTIPPEEIATLTAGRTELVLVPKGIGKLEILVANLFREIKQGTSTTFRFTIMNAGTLALRDITPTLDLPLDWEGTLEPKAIEVIEPAKKAVFTAEINPPPQAAIGEYTIRIAAQGYSGIDTVEPPEKDFTVRIVAKRNITGTAILVAVLIIMVLAIAGASIKVARR